MPIMNPKRGRELLHRVPRDQWRRPHTPPLDAHTLQPLMNPFDFVAKMCGTTHRA
jgi:hypothetical protein